MTRGSPRTRLLALLAPLALVGCGGSDNGTSPTPSISISVTPSTLTIEQGESASLSVEASRGGGYTGAVELAVEGLPAGVTASTTGIPSGATQGSVTLDAGAAADPGTHTLTVNGSGSDGVQASATVTLDVEEAPVPAFSLELDPAQLEFDQGSEGSSTVTIQRSGGFDGAVQLSVSGAPDGLEATLGSESVSGGQTSLEVSAASDLSPDTYTLTVSGSADGLDDQSAELLVTINESDDPDTVQGVWTFCEGVPEWFAVRDGDSGEWTRVEASGGDTFEFEVTSTRAGVAFVEDGEFGSTELTVYLLGAQELASVGNSLCEEAGARTVDVTVQDLGADEIASLSLGPVSTMLMGAMGTSATLRDIPAGPVDLFGARAQIDLSSGAQSVNRLYLERDLDPADGSTVTVDFSGTHSFDPVTETATIQNLNGDLASLFVGFGGFARASLSLGFGTMGLPSADETRPVPFVPEDRMREGDFHNIFVVAMPDLESPERFRAAVGFRSAASEIQVSLGPDLSEPEVAVTATAPYVRPRVQYARQAEYDRAWFSTFGQDGTDASVLMSSEYRGSGDVDLTLPDFSDTDGWNEGWGLRPGEEIEVSLVAVGWEGTGVLVPASVADELAMRFATRLVTLDP